jgi:tetratricopeptide (TPR) repeat protein
VLGDLSLPAAIISSVDNRGRHVFIVVAGPGGQERRLLIKLTTGDADELKAELGRARARAWAQVHREELQEQERGGEYRDVICPHCQATVDLTGMSRSPQVYCPFCHRIGTLGAAPEALAAESRYRLCDVCGMYGKPRRFTIFYFYFLLVLVGIHRRITWRCPACMRVDAWKMLLGNLLFVIGVPVALVQLFRSYGGADFGGLYPGIHTANFKARRGDLARAIEGYRKILAEHPTAAGVKYNIGAAALAREDPAGAAGILEEALRDCSNYLPAARALERCYRRAGQEEKLRELRVRFGIQGS